MSLGILEYPAWIVYGLTHLLHVLRTFIAFDPALQISHDKGTFNQLYFECTTEERERERSEQTNCNVLNC